MAYIKNFLASRIWSKQHERAQASGDKGLVVAGDVDLSYDDPPALADDFGGGGQFPIFGGRYKIHLEFQRHGWLTGLRHGVDRAGKSEVGQGDNDAALHETGGLAVHVLDPHESGAHAVLGHAGMNIKKFGEGRSGFLLARAGIVGHGTFSWVDAGGFCLGRESRIILRLTDLRLFSIDWPPVLRQIDAGKGEQELASKIHGWL